MRLFIYKRVFDSPGFLLVLLIVVLHYPRSFAGVVTEPAADSLFSYDRSVSFELKEVGREKRGRVSVTDIVFVPAATRVRAYLVAPLKVRKSAPAILFVHWLGDPATTNRTQFLEEAVTLAERGVVSLLVDTMWAEPNWYANRIPEKDFDDGVHQVIELRRAMDLLIAQPGVDSKRIAMVAHDFGAMYGLIAEAIDRRARTYILMAPTSHYIDWFLFARQPVNLPAYQEKISTIDPVLFLARLAPASLFLQFGSKDEYVSAEEAIELYSAATPRKQMTTYDVGHDLNTPAAREDRLQWLVRELNL